MGSIDLRDLPEGARFESAVLARTEIGGNHIPSWFFSGLKDKSLETYYLTTTGDFCPILKKAKSGFPNPVFFNMKEVVKIDFQGKEIRHNFQYHFGTFLISLIGFIPMMLGLIIMSDVLLNFDSYLSGDLTTVNTGGASDSDDSIGYQVLVASFALILLSLPWIIVIIIPLYITKNLHHWGRPSKLIFHFNNGRSVALFGKFPFESRYLVSRLGWLSLFVCFPVIVVQPYILTSYVGAVALILIAQGIWILMIEPMFVEEEMDADSSMGFGAVLGIRGFHESVMRLSSIDENSAIVEGGENYNFIQLIDKLSGEVRDLVERMSAHERGLSAITEGRWEWVHRVSEIDQGVNQIRKCAERVIGHRCQQIGRGFPRKPSLTDLKKILHDNDRENTPDRVLANIDVIREVTGGGSHAASGYSDDEDQYIIGLRALASLIDWHFDNPVKKSVLAYAA